MEFGYKLTRRGKALMAACLDRGLPLKITRAAVGSGTLPEGAEAEDQAVLLCLVADAAIIDRRHEGDQLFLTVQFSPQDHPAAGAFTLSEIMVYAQDPESGGEIGFLYASLGSFAQLVPAYGANAFGSVWSFPMVLVVSSELRVDITASPGLITCYDLQDAVDALKLELMTNEVTLPLETASGEALLTSSGTPLLAVYHPDRLASALAAVAALEGRLSGQIEETAGSLSADVAAASLRNRAYAEGRVLALGQAVDGKLEAQAAEAEEKIQTAKAEAVSAAGEDAAAKADKAKTEAIAAAEQNAAAQVNEASGELYGLTLELTDAILGQIDMVAQKVKDHNDDAGAHPSFLRAAEDTVPPDPEKPAPMA